MTMVKMIQAAIAAVRAPQSCAGFKELLSHERRLHSVWYKADEAGARAKARMIRSASNLVSARLDEMARQGCDATLEGSYRYEGREYSHEEDRWVMPA